MAFRAVNASEDTAEELLGRLGRPAFTSAADLLTLNRGYEVPSPHPALGGDAGPPTALNSLPVPSSGGATGYPLPPVAMGTGAYLPRPRGDLDAVSLAAPAERPLCTFFLRTGTCAYGDRCKFQHPRDRPPPVLNSRGYPVRPEELDCAHYLKKGWCAFNLTCKFNHPELPPPVLPGSPYGIAQQQQFVNMSGNAGGYAPAGTLYSLAPSAVPVMYYVQSPIGPTTLGGNSFQTPSYPQNNAAVLQAAYSGNNSAGLATTAGQAYRQQQQAMAAAAAAQQQLQQQQQQQQTSYGNLHDPSVLHRSNQLAGEMQKLRLTRGSEHLRQQQQQQR